MAGRKYAQKAILHINKRNKAGKKLWQERERWKKVGNNRAEHRVVQREKSRGIVETRRKRCRVASS